MIRNNVGPKEEEIVGIKCFIAVYIAHILFTFWRNRPPNGPGPPSFTIFLNQAQRRTAVGRTTLDE
jgi:hypothetical protein